MAKKTSKPAAKGKKKAAPAKKKAPAKKVEHVEIELDPIETKAFQLAHSTEKVREELEEAVTSAISGAVRKVFKSNGIALTTDQAQEVALLLFGD